jgi:hypothetical protein
LDIEQSCNFPFRLDFQHKDIHLALVLDLYSYDISSSILLHKIQNMTANYPNLSISHQL